MRVCSTIRQTREFDDSFLAQNHVSASISEDHTVPSAKRQRRPNVRLEQLGGQHAADKRKKKKGKAQKTGISMRNGVAHRQNFLKACSYLHRSGNALLGCVEKSTPSLPAFQKEINAKNPTISGKNVRKGSQKSGVPKMDAAVGQLGYPVCNKEKASIMQEAADLHLDKENISHSSARFEGSEFGDVVIPSEGLERGAMVMLHSCGNCQSEDVLPARARVERERRNQWSQESSRMQGFKLIEDADAAKRMTQANGSGNRQMHSTRNKLNLEANGMVASKEWSKKNEGRTGSRSSVHGVREWLEGLGLDKYAEIFEAHEVDPEVLPLLTLDDLREMGVAAVGSRRKLLAAIQDMRENLLAQTE